MAWKQRLVAAIRAEVAAEKAAVTAETEKRATWWETTWSLAEVPRAEWSAAQSEYVKRTGHSQSEANKRRRTGTHLTESSVDGTLPTPSFAREANDWLGKAPTPEQVVEALHMLAQAEKDKMSLREVRSMFTGKPFTNTPENLTEADEDAVVERVAKKRPRVIARHVRTPAVAAAVVDDDETDRVISGEQLKRSIRRRDQKSLERNRQQNEEFGRDIEEATTEFEQNPVVDVDHEMELELRIAVNHLRRACLAQQRNHVLTVPQGERVDLNLTEAEHLIKTMRGESSLTEEDEAWLEELSNQA
jgi:hypothetical protein